MAGIEKLFRLRVYETDGTTVDFTETTDISGHGPVGGQRVEPLKARTSARPWDVTIADVGEKITARLADSDGRAQLLRRLGDWSVSTDDGSSWTVLATGRVDKVQMVDVSAFRFTFQDERLIERTTTIFRGSSSTRLAPAGFNSAWRSFQPPGPFRFVLVNVDATNNRSRYSAIGNTRPAPNRTGLRVSDDAMELMESDQQFETLRVNLDGTDREIASFNRSPFANPLKNLRDGDTEQPTIFSFDVDGYQDPGTVDQTLRDAYFHMPDHTPTEAMPLHIGGQAGVDPFQHAKDIYDGEYQDTANPATVRYSSDHFSAYHPTTNPQGLIGRFPRIHPRIEGPMNMAAHLDRDVYAKNRVVPIINEDGEIAPVVVAQPTPSEISDPDTLFEFNKSNLTLPHPGWLNQGRDQATVTRVTFEYARPARQVPNDEGALDGMARVTREDEHESDKASEARIVHELTVGGVHDLADQWTYSERVAREIHDRHADGPIYTEGKGTSATDSVKTGDWCVLDLDTYPALQNQSRSGKRIVQVLSKTIDVDGPTFELMEAGPSLQPLSTPSVSLAANSDDPHNAIDVTISGLGTGEGYELHVAENGSEPSEDSDEWQYRTFRGDTNETVTVRRVPSGETLWGRVRATQRNRISSDWSTADSQATTALSAPTSVSDSDVAGGVATISWTNGEDDYDILVDLDGDTTTAVRLIAGSTSYTFEGLDASTAYTAGVRHVDDYGGESSRATDGFTTTATDEGVATPEGIRVLVG